jgi:hypothetical protein
LCTGEQGGSNQFKDHSLSLPSLDFKFASVAVSRLNMTVINGISPQDDTRDRFR